MKKLITGVALFASTLLTGWSDYERPLEQLFPKEPLLYVFTESLEPFAKMDKKHPIKQLWENPTVKDYLLQELKVRNGLDAMNKNQEEDKKLFGEFIKKHCKGRIALSIHQMTADDLKSKAVKTGQNAQFVSQSQFNIGSVKFSIAAECSATRKQLETLLTEAEESVKPYITKKIEDQEVYVLEGLNEKEEPLVCTLMEGLFLAAANEDLLVDMIMSVKDKNKSDNLASNPRYMDTKDIIGKSNGYVYSDLVNLYENFIHNEDTSILNQIDKNPMLKTMISTKAIREDLHLDSFSSFFASYKVEDESMDMKYGFTVKSKEGLVNIFSYGKESPAMPEFAFEDFKAVSISSFDMSKSFAALEKLVKAVSPMALMTMTMQYGNEFENFKTNIVHNLEPYIFTSMGYADSNKPKQEYPSEVFVFKVKDPKALNNAIGTILNKVGQEIKTENFMDEKIYSLVMPMGLGMNAANLQASYISLVGKHLVFVRGTEKDMVKKVIAQIKKPGKSLIKHDGLKNMWDSMKDGEVAMDYTDLAQAIMNAYYIDKQQQKTLNKTLANLPEEQRKALKQADRKIEKPNVDGIHASLVSKTYHLDHLWYSTIRLENYDPLQN